jgi:subtilisin family serine protease
VKSLIDDFSLHSGSSISFPSSKPLTDLLAAAMAGDETTSLKCSVPKSRITAKKGGFIFEDLKGVSNTCFGELINYLAASDYVMRVSIDSRPRVNEFNTQDRHGFSSTLSQDILQGIKYPRFSSKEALESDFRLSGRGQIIGLADTGLDDSSCFLSDSHVEDSIPRDGKLYAGREKVVQYVPFADSRDDSAGHGTHIAGILNGRAVDTFSSVEGYACDSKISFFDIGVSGTQNLHLPSHLSDIFSVAYSSGARVHADPWGSSGNTYSMLSQEVDAFTFQHSDFLVILSAGNAGVNGKYTVGNPATSKNALVIGATQTKNSNTDAPVARSTLAYFSSMGPTSDGRLKPDLVAPGYSILSARAYSSEQNSCSLQEMSGTSTSVAVVAAAAAMLKEFFSNSSYWAATCDKVIYLHIS